MQTDYSGKQSREMDSEEFPVSTGKDLASSASCSAKTLINVSVSLSFSNTSANGSLSSNDSGISTQAAASPLDYEREQDLFGIESDKSISAENNENLSKCTEENQMEIDSEQSETKKPINDTDKPLDSKLSQSGDAHLTDSRKCSVCNKLFANVYRLARHRICHLDGAELRKFRCIQCNKAFKV